MSVLDRTLNPLRRVVRRARRLRDRVLHPGRQRRAIESLKAKSFQRILVMCYGNVCRSPYAAERLRRLLMENGRADIVIDSAGVVGPDRSTPARGLAVAAELGLDLTEHRSKLVTAASLQAAQLILVMSAEQAADMRWRGAPASATVVVLGDLDSGAVDERTIRDPWNCDEDVFRQSYRRIDRCIGTLVREIQRQRVAPTV